MNRRGFLKSIGALGLSPLLPGVSLAKAVMALPASGGASSSPYMWAETIVRAHNQCTLGLLQRHLKIDYSAAVSVQTELIKNGVINVHANEFGIRTATKPLFEGAFLQNSKPPVAGDNALTDAFEKTQITEDRDDLSESGEDPVESALIFDEADVEMVTCEDVLAIMEKSGVRSSV